MKTIIKKTLLLCCSLIIFSCSNANDLKEFELKGKVKSCFECIYNARMDDDDKWIEGHLVYNAEHDLVLFDKDGFWEEHVEYRGGNEEIVKKSIPIRENGKIVEIRSYDFQNDYMGSSFLKYLSNDIVETETYDEDGKKDSYGKDIFSNGLRIGRTFTIIDKNKSYSTKTDYDKNGTIISYKVTEENGEILSESKFECIEYDKKGNWIRKLMFINDETLIVKREIEYY